MNDELIDFSETLAELNLGDGCRFADAQCDQNPCTNGGTCVGEWGGYYCDCVHAFAGINCTKGINFDVIHFLQAKEIQNLILFGVFEITVYTN